MHRKGFTLIELLVVVAIVGILASVILASLNIGRERARIAAGKQFSANVLHGVGDYLMGQWGFDEGSGSVANDTSGNGNNGTIEGNPTFVDGIQDRALNFDGNDSVGIYNPNLNVTGAITFSAWFNTNSTYPSNYGTIFWGSAPDSHFVVSDGNILFSLSISGIRRAIVAPITTGKWHHVAGGYDGSIMKLYVDGQLKSESSSYPGVVAFTSGAGEVSVGRYCCGGTYYFNGSIDEARIYSSAITVAEVEKLYAEGLGIHNFLATK